MSSGDADDGQASMSPSPNRSRITLASAGATARAAVGGGRGLIALALVVGAGAGGGAVGFRYLIIAMTELFTGHTDYSAAGHVANPNLPGLGIWFVALAPVVGGLLYGPLVARFAPEARGHGVPEVMLAVAEFGGRIRPQVPIVKALASALCIGSGGSVGREGPIVQIGSALGSVIGQLARVPERRLRLLVACGAAGGISATFNAPIAGVFFALEVILRDFETDSFGLVVLSSVAADAIGRAAFGSATFLSLPAFTLSSPLEFVLYGVLGAVAGVVGVVFIRVLYGGEDLADRLWRGPAWACPAVGGVLLGGLLLVLPEMYGVGYPVLTRAVDGHYALAFVLVLLAAKIVATSLTIAIGGSGGVFAPALFMGAMLGSGFGQATHALLPSLTGPSGAYALVGMGAVFAGAARAPITAVIIIFELTGDYGIVLPLMLAIVLATAVSKRLAPYTIYTLKLLRRGIELDRPRVVSMMRTIAVSSAMGPLPESLHRDAPLTVVLERLAERQHDAIMVVDDTGGLLGVITATDIEQRALTRESRDMSAGHLAHGTVELRADDSLEKAIHALSRSDDPGLPVLAAGGGHVGWLTHRNILMAYEHERERPPPGEGSQTPSPATGDERGSADREAAAADAVRSGNPPL